MIENLSKYKAVITLLIVLVIISFIMMDANNMQKSQGGIDILKIGDRNYTDGDVKKLGEGGYQIAQAFAQSGDYQLFGFISTLSGNPGSQDEVIENFFTNRILLREAREAFGIHPSDQDVASQIRQLRMFSNQDGAFSDDAYNNFMERGLGRMGMGEADVRDLVIDILTYNKLSEIIGSGLTTDRNIVAKENAINSQRINAKIARLDIDQIRAGITVSDEEVKPFWESVQDAFKTDEKRKFTYLIASPVLPAEPAAIPALDEKADDAAKAEYARKSAERDATIAENKRLARIKIGGQVDHLLYQLESQENLSFEQAAQNAGFQLKTSELVTAKDAPAEFLVPVRGSSIPGTAIDAIFRVNVTADPVSRMIELGVGENDWFIARVDQIEPSRTKTFEEAKDLARARLLSNRVAEAFSKAANDANARIKAELAAGKSFEDAAKAAGINAPVTEMKEVSQNTEVDAKSAPAYLFNSARYVTPGQLTEPIIEQDRAFIVLVGSREVIKDETSERMLDMQIRRSNQENQISAMGLWLAKQYETAKVEQLNRR
ncbi:MAG: hypothetical protein RL346_1222 [Verrucomicrobiota bacterium]|jgi:hypothetical protein